MKKDKLKQWRKTQEHWDDDEFLGSTANAFMKLRWKRLNERCAREASLRPEKAALVDVGCAHADFYGFAKPFLKSYTGIEPSKELLPRSVKKGAGFRLLRGKAEKLPLRPSSADFILIKEVLDHCYDPLKVMSEARRVLRPGGELLITLTNDAAWYKLLFSGWASRIKSTQHDHLYFFRPDEVIELARQAGFGAVSTEDSHYLRLPYRMEQALGSLPSPLGKAVIAFSDAIGELVLPGAGGSFWVRCIK